MGIIRVVTKSYRAPQKSKPYEPKVEKEKTLKTRGIPVKKKLKHKKAYYDYESDT